MTSQAWLSALTSASIEGGVLLVAVWAVTRLWPHMPATARCGLWWLGSLRMLYGLIPIPSLPLRLAADWVPARPTLPTPVIEWGHAVAGAVAAPPIGVAPRSPMDLVAPGLVILWASGLVIGIALLAHRLIRLRRMWRSATRFEDPRAIAAQDAWAIAIGRANVPEIRISPDTLVPVTIGYGKPGLLLPADAASLSDDALRMVFAHELSHVRRRDPLLAWVPAAAQLVFWFHPLVWLAGREFLAAREQICDADALRATGVSPRDYGSLLVAFGVGNPSDMPGAASCGSSGVRDLKRRLDMLSRNAAIPTVHRVGALALVLAIMTLAFAPVRLVVAHESAGKSSEGGASERIPIAYMLKTKGLKGTRGSVDMSDMKAARKLDRADETVVYFRLGEEMWISRDASVIAEVRRALEPEDRIDARRNVAEGRRDALESERERLEAQRAELEARKSELETIKADLDAKIERLFEQGQSTRAAKAALADVASQLEVVWGADEKLSKANRMLSERLKELHADEMESYAEQTILHEKILDRIAEIARKAIDGGRAEVMTP